MKAKPFECSSLSNVYVAGTWGAGGHFIHPISLTLLYTFCEVFSYFYSPFVLSFSFLQGTRIA